MELKRSLTKSIRKLSLKFNDQNDETNNNRFSMKGSPPSLTALSSYGIAEAGNGSAPVTPVTPVTPITPNDTTKEDFFSLGFDQHNQKNQNDTTLPTGSVSFSKTRTGRSLSSVSSFSISQNRTEAIAPSYTPPYLTARSDSASSLYSSRAKTATVITSGTIESHSPTSPASLSDDFNTDEAAHQEDKSVHEDIAAEMIALDILNKVQDQQSNAKSEGWAI